MHYTNRRTGAEHLWGLGHLRMMTNAIACPDGAALQSVVTSSTVPGLCVGLGRDHFGISFGFTRRQQIAVYDSTHYPPLMAPARAPAVSLGNARSLWGFGHLKMRGVPAGQGHHAVVTGQANAGLHASVGSASGFLFGAHSRQQVVMGDDASLTFAAPNNAWPYFDYFTLQVTVLAPNIQPNQGNNTPP